LENPHFTEDITIRADYWKIRKGMFPSIGASRARGTGIINEDIAVPIESLSAAVKDLRILFTKYHFHEAIIFGHAKDGNLHFVIAHGFDTDEDIHAFGTFMHDLAQIIIDKYQGSLKAEHGTGRNIAPFVGHEWGDEAYYIMKRIKQLFDPHGIMNPGIIISEDPECHIKHVKPFPIVHDIIDSCIECGYCESHCPTHQYTLSPRQRIIIDREISLHEDPVIIAELSAFAKHAQIDSCATDGLCSLACPVHINTGEYMLGKRVENLDTEYQELYSLEAKAILKRDTAIKRKLNAGHLAAKIIGGTTLQSMTKIGNALFDTPQWIPGIHKSWKKKVHGFNEQASFMYLPSCTSRLFAKPHEESLALPDLIISLSKEAGFDISIPNDIEERCCGLAYASKGAIHASKLAFNNWVKELPSNTIILTDAYSCYAHVQSSMNIMDMLTFAAMLVKSLPIQRIDGTAVLHPPCSMQLQQQTQKMKQIADQLATQIFIPESLGCCGFAGDHGFTEPALSEHACAYMKTEIEQVKDVIGYYSMNPTCELGMKIGTGHSYVSLFYLIASAVKF
jgi:D-lactate dehydrogenase